MIISNYTLAEPPQFIPVNRSQTEVNGPQLTQIEPQILFSLGSELISG
jgi:hypothetical protein